MLEKPRIIEEQRVCLRVRFRGLPRKLRLKNEIVSRWFEVWHT